MDEDLKEGLEKSMSEPAKKAVNDDEADNLHKSRQALRATIADRNKAFKDLDAQARADKKKKIDEEWNSKFDRNRG